MYALQVLLGLPIFGMRNKKTFRYFFGLLLLGFCDYCEKDKIL